jgi:hypothetical protein
MVLDALEADPSDAAASADAAQATVAGLSNLPWEPAPTIGLGEEFRVTTPDRVASALVCEGRPVHVSMVASRHA